MGSGTNVRSEGQHYSGQELELLLNTSIWKQDRATVTHLHPRATQGQGESGLYPRPKDQSFFWEVFKLILGKSIHPDWVLIHQHHIRVHKQVVNIGSFIVCLDSQKHIYLLPLLSLPGGLMKRKNTKKGQSGAEAGNDEEEV